MENRTIDRKISNRNSIVVSSRVRLARNVLQFVYPSKMLVDQGYALMKKMASVCSEAFDSKVYLISSLSEVDAGVMLEKHLISPNLLKNRDFGAVVTSPDETISVMLNEEDHLRAQCILPGLQLELAYATLSQIDDKLNQKLDFAFDNNMGYLTSCVTNVGTGMRASVMVFLPALCLSGKIDAITENLKRLGISVRGVFGEGSEAEGYHYQISNMTSLGISEKEIILNVTDAVKLLEQMEKDERVVLLKERPVQIKNMILRAFAVLTGAYSISHNEFMQMIAQVKLGVAIGILRFKDNSLVDKIVFQCLPSSMRKIAKKDLTKEEEDIFRAEYLNRILLHSRI